MIIVDTDVWIDHFNRADPTLAWILATTSQSVHPFVIGEVALGNLRDRATVIELLETMPSAEVALHPEILRVVADHGLQGTGIGYVDAHLIASAKLMPGARIWSRDKRLAAACARLDLSFRPPH